MPVPSHPIAWDSHYNIITDQSRHTFITLIAGDGVTHQNVILYNKRLCVFIYLSGVPPQDKEYIQIYKGKRRIKSFKNIKN